MFFIDIVGLDDVVCSPQNQVSVGTLCSSSIEKEFNTAAACDQFLLQKAKNIAQKTKKKCSDSVIPIPGVEPGSTRIIANESIESG